MSKLQLSIEYGWTWEESPFKVIPITYDLIYYIISILHRVRGIQNFDRTIVHIELFVPLTRQLYTLELATFYIISKDDHPSSEIQSFQTAHKLVQPRDLIRPT